MTALSMGAATRIATGWWDASKISISVPAREITPLTTVARKP